MMRAAGVALLLAVLARALDGAGVADVARDTEDSGSYADSDSDEAYESDSSESNESDGDDDENTASIGDTNVDAMTVDSDDNPAKEVVDDVSEAAATFGETKGMDSFGSIVYGFYNNANYQESKYPTGTSSLFAAVAVCRLLGTFEAGSSNIGPLMLPPLKFVMEDKNSPATGYKRNYHAFMKGLLVPISPVDAGGDFVLSDADAKKKYPGILLQQLGVQTEVKRDNKPG